MKYAILMVLALLAMVLAGCVGFEAKNVMDPCEDGLFSSDETDTDCGGNCAPCDLDQICEENADCESLYCAEDFRCSTASCEDGVMNGNEEDIDCGGTCDACPEVNLQADVEGAELLVKRYTDDVEVTVSYKNTGDMPAELPFNNELVLSTLDGQVLATKYSSVVDTITIDGKVSISETLESSIELEAGTYYLEVYVDIDDIYDEFDEEDNYLKETIILT